MRFPMIGSLFLISFIVPSGKCIRFSDLIIRQIVCLILSDLISDKASIFSGGSIGQDGLVCQRKTGRKIWDAVSKIAGRLCWGCRRCDHYALKGCMSGLIGKANKEEGHTPDHQKNHPSPNCTFHPNIRKNAANGNPSSQS
jgi:hypothetical protein